MIFLSASYIYVMMHSLVGVARDFARKMMAAVVMFWISVGLVHLWKCSLPYRFEAVWLDVTVHVLELVALMYVLRRMSHRLFPDYGEATEPVFLTTAFFLVDWKRVERLYVKRGCQSEDGAAA